MGYFSKTKDKIAESYRTDPNIAAVKSHAGPMARRLPLATVDYLVEKLPVAQWLPHYHPRWIIQDVIAGITLGVMFIPQGLAYAKIATIPIEHGLYSCWIPSALYFFLGTSKGESWKHSRRCVLLTRFLCQNCPPDQPPSSDS